MHYVSKIFSLCLVIFLGICSLQVPFGGDQPLFMQGALTLNDGGVLYRDFWDLKQPAIFFFYLIGGKAFGFTESGIHIFELLYMTTLSLFLMCTMQKYFKTPSFVAFIPFLSVGAYYCISWDWTLTQVEGLIGFPIFLSIWAFSRAFEGNRINYWFLFLAGLMGSISGLFKLFYVPLVCLLWLPACVYSEGKFKITQVIRALVFAVIWLFIPFVLIFSYYSHLGLGELVYKTTFVYPMHIAKITHNQFLSLPRIEWLIYKYYPLVILSLIWFYWMLKKAVRTPLLISLFLWMPLGIFFIHVQLMRWHYQNFLLMVPMGVLSSLGLDYLWSSLKNDRLIEQNRIAKTLCLLLSFALFTIFLKTGESKISFLVKGLLSKTQIDWSEFQDSFAYHKKIKDEVAFLKNPTSKQGQIYVFGSPTYYWLSNRRQASSIPAWSLSGFTDEQKNKLTNELKENKPVYIFAGGSSFIESNFNNIFDFVSTNYKVYNVTEAGTWYEIRE